MDIIFQRRSVRRFQKRPVEPEKIEQILRAAMAAPSAGNQQPWEFFVVRNREKLAALAQVHPYAGPAADAPVAIVAAYRQAGCAWPQYAQIDMAACVQNLWLATDALGLGGVWLGIAPEPDRMEKVAAILPLPEGLTAFAVFPLGYPEGERGERPDRYQPERAHYID